MKPKEFVTRYVEANPNATASEVKKAEDFVKRQKTKQSQENLPRGITLNCRAAVKMTLDKHL